MGEMTTDNSLSVIAAQAAEVLWYHRLLINQKALEREDRVRKKQIDDIITIINTLRQDHGRFVTRNEVQQSVQAEVHRELKDFEDRNQRYADERLIQFTQRLEPLEHEIKSLRESIVGNRQRSSDGLNSLHDRVARVELQSRDNRQRLVETDLEVSRLQHQHFVEPLDRVRIPSINFSSSDDRLGQTRNGERYPSLDKRWEEFPADQNIHSPVTVVKIVPETQEVLATRAREALAVLQPSSLPQRGSSPHEVLLSRQIITRQNAKRRSTNHSISDQLPLPKRANHNSRSSITERQPLSERPLEFTQPASADDVFGGVEPVSVRKAILGSNSHRSRSNTKEAQGRIIPVDQPRLSIPIPQVAKTLAQSDPPRTGYPMAPPPLTGRVMAGSMAPPATPLPTYHQTSQRSVVQSRLDSFFSLRIDAYHANLPIRAVQTPAGRLSSPWQNPGIRRSGAGTSAGRLKRPGVASIQQSRRPTQQKQGQRRPSTVAKTPHKGSHIVMGMPVQGSQPRYMKQSEMRPESADTPGTCRYDLRAKNQVRLPSRLADMYILEPNDPPPTSRVRRATRTQRQNTAAGFRQGTGLGFEIFEDNDPTAAAVQQRKPPHLQYGRLHRRAIPR